MAEIANIQIENDIYSLKDVIARSKNSEQDTKLQSLEEWDAVANQRITNVTNLANSNSARLDEISRKFFIFIGDSYMYGYTPDGKITGFMDIVKSIIHFNGNIFARGGEAFGKTNQNGNFLDRLKDFSGDKNQVTHIIVIGGSNDYDVATNKIIAGIQEFCTYAYANFPNAMVYIAFNGWGTSSSHFYGLSNALEAYQTGSRNSKCAFINNLQYVLHDSDLFVSDGIHPNTNGQNELAYHMINWMSGGEINVNKILKPASFTPAYSGANLTLYTKINNELATVLHPTTEPITISGAGSHTWNGFRMNRIQIGVILSSRVLGNSYGSPAIEQNATCLISFPTICQIGSTWFLVNCTLTIIASGVFLDIMGLNSGGSNYLSGTITTIVIPQFNLICDSMMN